MNMKLHWKLKNLFGIFLTLLFLTLFSGCATIVNKDFVEVPVVTHPEGATLYVNGKEYTSPAVIPLPRAQGGFELYIEMEGYKPGIVMLKDSFEWKATPLTFGLIGYVVDEMSGNAYGLEPAEVEFWLAKEGTPEIGRLE